MQKWWDKSSTRDVLDDLQSCFMKVIDTSVEHDSDAGESRGKGEIVAAARWYVIKTGTEDKGAERKEGAEVEKSWPTKRATGNC